MNLTQAQQRQFQEQAGTFCGLVNVCTFNAEHPLRWLEFSGSHPHPKTMMQARETLRAIAEMTIFELNAFEATL